MGQIIPDDRRFRLVTKDLYVLEGNVENPPKVFIDDVEGYYYIRANSTSYNEFYTKRNLE